MHLVLYNSSDFFLSPCVCVQRGGGGWLGSYFLFASFFFFFFFPEGVVWLNSGNMYLLCTEESRVGSDSRSSNKWGRLRLSGAPLCSLFPAPSYPQFFSNYLHWEKKFSKCTAWRTRTYWQLPSPAAGIPNVICKLYGESWTSFSSFDVWRPTSTDQRKGMCILPTLASVCLCRRHACAPGDTLMDHKKHNWSLGFCYFDV